jgi:ferredoxin-NADP reductase
MAMLRRHACTGSTVDMRLLYSARSLEDVIYRDELSSSADDEHRTHVLSLTRETTRRWRGHRGRIDASLRGEVGWTPRDRPLCYVCGPTPFVEAVSVALLEVGHAASRVRTERFGPTGD